MGNKRGLAYIGLLSVLVGCLLNFIFFVPLTLEGVKPFRGANPGLVERVESDTLVSASDIIRLFRNSEGKNSEDTVQSDEASRDALEDQDRGWVLLGSIFGEEQAKAFVLSLQGEVIELVPGKEFGRGNRVKEIAPEALVYENEDGEVLILRLYNKDRMESTGVDQEV